MWAHYAKGAHGEDHEGFLVELKVHNTVTSYMEKNHDFHLIPIPVNYVDTRPEFDPINPTDQQGRQALVSKSKDWEYEQEERVLSIGSGIKLISSDLVSSVIAGLRMKEPEFKVLQKAVDEHNRKHGKSIKLFRARAHPRDYKVIVDNHPRLCETPENGES